MKPILVVVAAGLLAGCMTPQNLVNSGPSAELSFNLESDAAGGIFGQHSYIEKFNDPTCKSDEHGVLVAKKPKNKPMPAIRLPVGRPVTLAFWYIRGDFGVNRQCSYTWTFTPVAGSEYTANLQVSNRLFCAVAITSASGAPIATTHPVNTCIAGLAHKKVQNGRSVIVHYYVR